MGASSTTSTSSVDRDALARRVAAAIDAQPVTDMHTHCYPPTFGATRYDGGEGAQPHGLLLWGVDELVTYHYLVAEVFRVVPATQLPYDAFWRMSKPEQADHIWQHLFVENTPISEACRGVLTALSKLGLDFNEKTLTPCRKWFAEQRPDAYIDKVMELAGVDSITMTNPVFDDSERSMWLNDAAIGDDPRFTTVLRIDPLLRQWDDAAGLLREWGYDVSADFTGNSIAEAQRFLRDWIDRIKAVYVAVSLPPEFRYPAAESAGATANEKACDRVIRDILMPVLAERGLPFAMMIGSELGVNPSLGDAGDMVGKADVQTVVHLCRSFPENKFLVTMLSRENQHELCVATRKFGNLLLFGCWWFLNNPSIIEEMTRERLELLGTTFVPQHSDARVLDQLIYKWDHSRRIIAKVLADKYADAVDAGYDVTDDHIRRDARLLLRDNFRNFLKR